jgi:hypothetical protein
MSEEIKNEQVEVEQTEQQVEAQPEVKTFTQDEVNELIEKRLQRERKKTDKYSDYDEIKTKASEYEKLLEEKRMSELSEKERLEEIAKKYEEEKQGLAKELEAVREQAKRKDIVNAFIKAAPSVNIPTDRIDAALKLADLSAVEVEDGEVNGLDVVLNTLVEQYSFLSEVKKPQKPIGESTNGNRDTSEKTAEQLLSDAMTKAKRTGKLEDRMAVAALKRELGI